MINELNNLDPKLVQRNLAILKQFISEVEPDLAVDSGPFHDLVLYYSALFSAANQQQIRNALEQFNLERMLQNPDAVSSTALETLLSNWLIHRRQGSCASGMIILNIEPGFNTFILSAGKHFSANGINFKTTQVYHAHPANIQNISYERQTVPVGDGTWSFIIPITAEVIGSAGNIKKGTPLNFDHNSLLDISFVCAYNDFTGGADLETNKQMLDRFMQMFHNKQPSLIDR